MSSFLELQNDVYFWLGTTDQNKAFPRDQIKRRLNQAKDGFYSDCVQSYPDALAVIRTLTADPTDPTSYVLNTQNPALGDVEFVIEVALNDAQGCTLREVPLNQRYLATGYTYSLIGIGASMTLYAGRNVASGTPLYFAYVPAVADMVDDGDTPSWLPNRFHDVLSMNAAKLCVTSGNEQTMNPLLLEALNDAEAQARFAFGQRSLSPQTMRER